MALWLIGLGSTVTIESPSALSEHRAMDENLKNSSSGIKPLSDIAAG